MMLTYLQLLVFSFLLLFTVSSIAVSPSQKSFIQKSRNAYTNKSILEILENDHRFSRLMNYVVKSRRLRDSFGDSNNNMTVFAPTNAAFASIKHQYPGKHFAEEEIEKILSYHVVPKEIIKKQELFNGRLIPTAYKEEELDGRPQQIRVQLLDRYVVLNMYCRIEEGDIGAANGIIHVIGAVLIPPPNMFEELSVVPTEFSITNTALLLTNLHEKIQKGIGVTFFAPNNLAWQALGHERLMHMFDPAMRNVLREIMLYHMSPNLLYSYELHDKHNIELPTSLLGYTLKLSSEFEDKQRNRGRVLLKVNGHPVVFHDAISRNGNMHIVEKLLCPCEHRKPAQKMGKYILGAAHSRAHE